MYEGEFCMKIKENVFDFSELGRAIKQARLDRGWTRERVGAELNIAPRYLVAIENDGQHPSLQVLYDLVNLFELSVDQYFHPDRKPEKSTQRRQLEALLDELDDPDLMVVSGTVKGILEARDAFGKKIAD